MEKIKGLINAPFTPFYENGEVNFEPIEAYANMLVKNGLKGVFINGSSGEGYMLTYDERIALAEKWVSVAPEGFKVIVHVGSTVVKDSNKLARHAQEIGAFGIGAMASPFPKVGRIEELVKYCEEIASGAPQCFHSSKLLMAVSPILRASNIPMKASTNTTNACSTKVANSICSTDRTKPFCQYWLWVAHRAASAEQPTTTVANW